MAIAVTEAVAEKANNANGTSYTYTAFTPAANSLLVVFVSATGTVAAAPTMTGGSLTWTRRKSQLFNAVDTLYVFTAPVGASPVATTPIFDCTGDAATGTIMTSFSVTGHDVLNPIVQALSEARTAANPTLTRSAANTANAYLAAFAMPRNPPTSAPPGGGVWTEVCDIGSTLPTTGMSGAYRATGETSTTVVFTSLSAAYGIMYLEIRADSTLAGTVAGTGAQTGTLTGAGALAGTIAGVGSQTGDLTSLASLADIAGTIAGTSSQTGTLTGAGALLATVAGLAAQTGTLLGAGALSATCAGASSQSATLAGDGALVATAAGLADQTGLLTGSGALSALCAADCTVTGDLTNLTPVGAIDGLIAGTCTVTGLLVTLTPALGGTRSDGLAVAIRMGM